MSIVPPVALGWQQGAAYGALGFPLAFAALPLYVHLPHFYVEQVGLSLAAIGLVLLLARLGDALIDPWLGVFSDWQAGCYQGDRRPLLRRALLPFALGLVMLFMPPPGAGLLWVVLALLLTYLGYSLVTINYHAWGAEIGVDAHQRTVVTAWREGFALCGVIIAAALPSLPAIAGAGPTGAMTVLAAVFVVALALTGWVTLRKAPVPGAQTTQVTRVAWTQRADKELSILNALSLSQRARAAMGHVRDVLRHDGAYVRLLAVLALSGFAASVPATLVLFFITDVLNLPEQQGLFLAVYFLAAALGLPGWVVLARRIGKVMAWALAMTLAIISFVWAYTLGPGDGTGFLVICLVTGIALGAELTLPPAILADLMKGRDDSLTPSSAHGGLYFGIWHFVTKLNLALAAGVALPLLAFLGYQAGASEAPAQWVNVSVLAAVYAVVPALVKCLALMLLVRWRSVFRG